MLCGCIGIVFVFNGNLYVATYLIWLAAIFDFLDGFVARWLNAYSDIGKELDSLADVITFGALPGFMMFHLLSESFPQTYWPYVAFLITAFSALRLAKFNVDTRQSDSFIGLPTPANALFISALPFVMMGESSIATFFSNGYTLLVISILFSLLLVAEMRLFALKFKNMKWQDNKVRFIFLILSLLLIAFLQITAIPIVIVLYIVLSIPGSRSHL